MKVDTWPLLASAVSVVTLVFGLMLAFRGYEWRKKRARLIEAVTLAFWMAAVSVILTRVPEWAGVMSVVGVIVAMFLSKRYVRYLYGAIGGAVFFVIGAIVFLGIWAIPVVELTLPWRIVLMVGVTAIGFRLGMVYSDLTVILSTALAGAQYTALGSLGLYAVVTDAASTFVGQTLLAAIVPITGLMITASNPGQAIIQWFIALVVLVSGAMHQWRRYQKPLQSAGVN